MPVLKCHAHVSKMSRFEMSRSEMSRPQTTVISQSEYDTVW